MILAVVGPTGVGKTKLSICLAKKYNAIIVNCDAFQIYKNMNIGTAKVTEEEKEGIDHYLFDIKEVDEYYSVKNYQDDLRNILDNFKDKNIILVGGTGLYLNAGIMDYRFDDDGNITDYSELTNEELYDLAIKKDSTMNINKNNRVRLVRFLNKKNIDNVEPIKLYDVLIIGLTTTRDTLYNVINKRVDNMIDNGLVDEVKSLYKKYPDARSINTAIGYKEIIKYLKKEITLDEAIELIKKNSRNYAKRQFTWFNNKLDVNWFNVNYDNFSDTIKEVEDFIEGEVNE